MSETISHRPPFWPSVFRLLGNSFNSLIHFVPFLLVRPFSRRAAYLVVLSWARTSCRILGITVSLRDDNRGNLGPKPHLYVKLNQVSLIEAAAEVLLLPQANVIMNLEYALLPLVGWARLILGGDVVIVRQWKAQAKRGIERATARLASGETWGISIEGARSPDGELLPYKKGPVVMALRAQATIIPAVGRGARDVWPRGDWRIRPGHIEIHLLKVIPTRGLSYEDRNAVLEQLRSVAEKELAKERAGSRNAQDDV